MNNDLKKRKRIFRGYPKDTLENTIVDAKIIEEQKQENKVVLIV